MSDDELETLVRLHQAELYRYLRYLGAERGAVAEDLVQETFLAALKSTAVPPFGSDERRQAAWLRGIARNLFLMHCRRQRVSPVTADSERVENAESVWASQFLRGEDGFDYIVALRKCMDRLGERSRQLVALQYTQRKSRAEMAVLVQMTEDGVKSLMRRIRLSLADCIRRRIAAEGAAHG